MKIRTHRIVKHHNRGLFKAAPDAIQHGVELEVKYIKGARIVPVNTRKARVIVTDVLNTEYFVGLIAFSTKYATRIANALASHNKSAIYSALGGIAIIPTVSKAQREAIKQRMHEREEREREKRKEQAIEAAKNVVDTLVTDEELAQIEAA